MRERDYALVTNRVKVTQAKTAIADTIGGKDYGITKNQRLQLLEMLYSIEQGMFNKIAFHGCTVSNDRYR